MELQKRFTSLEVSKELRKLGLSQEVEECTAYWAGDFSPRLFGWSEGEDKPYGDYVRAFDVAELGEMLPRGCASYRNKKGNWDCVPPVTMQHLPTIKDADTEADVRGKMLIYLIEKNLVYAH